MPNDLQSLAHTKWNCKYHIVFAPKYRRLVFYGEKKVEIGRILRQLCEWKGVEMPEILNEIAARLGHLPKYMGLDAGYHSAQTAHLLVSRRIQGVIGHRRHTHAGEHFGKYRFKYNPEYDFYTCPEHQRLYWKTTTRQGYRQYFSDSRVCQNCPRRNECFAAGSKRRLVERHVWQDDLDDIAAFTRTPNGQRLYNWRKETIERSFAEAKENHGLRFARMLGIQNMREQCFLTATVQNIKRLVRAC